MKSIFLVLFLLTTSTSFAGDVPLYYAFSSDGGEHQSSACEQVIAGNIPADKEVYPQFTNLGSDHGYIGSVLTQANPASGADVYTHYFSGEENCSKTKGAIDWLGGWAN